MRLRPYELTRVFTRLSSRRTPMSTMADTAINTRTRVVAALLQSYGYALRAGSRLGTQGIQRNVAKRHRSQFYEDVWREAAAEVGATFHVIDRARCKICRGPVSTLVHNNITMLDDVSACNASLNKPFVLQKLRSHDLPTPSYCAFSLNDLQTAYGFLSAHPLCVVKPAVGTGAGQGVTTGIETRRQLLQAAARASGYGSELLVEEQLQGDNLRLLYLDGQLLDAVLRRPPTVVGDGRSNISRLVAQLNRRRLRAGYSLAQVVMLHDLELDRTLARQGLSWTSVPPEGQRVVLKEVISDNMADENESVVDQLSKNTIASGARAAKVIGVRLAGVDVVTPDMHQSLENAGGKILEINAWPGFHYHYFRMRGPCRVAVPILTALLDQAENVIGPHVSVQL